MIDKGNLTTIIKFIVMTIAPAVGMSEALSSQLIPVLTAIIGFLLAYFDAKYPNTLNVFGNKQNTLETVACGSDEGA